MYILVENPRRGYPFLDTLFLLTSLCTILISNKNIVSKNSFVKKSATKKPGAKAKSLRRS